ncbi:MAG TPA: DUF5719 family protein [Acidimicrobiales bacterium]|nr:DUF5719 family protein [Acidimicrobiales bacterium]
MRSSRRFPWLAVLALVVAVVGFATTRSTPRNPTALPSGLVTSLNAESTALYCTGLTSGAPGRVSFFNTSGSARSVSVSVVSSSGRTWSGTLELAAHGGQILEPRVVDPPTARRAKSGKVTTASVTYATAAQISGGGVVAEEIEGNASVPCVSQGVTRWFAAGFNTLVGSDAYLSLYNPTATEAVANISVLEANGFYAPENMQGISVPAHAQELIDIGKSVVNTANVGVNVKVVRGSLAVVGEQDSVGTLSFDAGVTSAAAVTWFPAVTTANNATAQIRIDNPNDARAQVTASVSLAKFTISPQILSLAPYSSGVITITPNSAIPAAGYASVTVRSSVPVVSGLATGTGSWIVLSSPQVPSAADVVRDYSGEGFDVAEVTNTSSRAITVHVTTYATSPTTKDVTTTGTRVGAGTTVSLASLLGAAIPKPAGTYLVAASSPSAIVTLSLPSRPAGLYLQTPLDGR